MNLDNSSFSHDLYFICTFLIANVKQNPQSLYLDLLSPLQFSYWCSTLGQLLLFFLILDTLSFPFLPNKYRFGFISWLEFQSIFSDSKLFRYFMPRTLMPVQAIWRMKLLVHPEESSRTNWNHTTCPQSCSSWMKDSERHQRIKSEAWARLWHSHYHYNHEGGVNAGHAEGGTCHPWRSWKI